MYVCVCMLFSYSLPLTGLHSRATIKVKLVLPPVINTLVYFLLSVCFAFIKFRSQRQQTKTIICHTLVKSKFSISNVSFESFLRRKKTFLKYFYYFNWGQRVKNKFQLHSPLSALILMLSKVEFRVCQKAVFCLIFLVFMFLDIVAPATLPTKAQESR